jgi:hypothetical protein
MRTDKRRNASDAEFFESHCEIFTDRTDVVEPKNPAAIRFSSLVCQLPEG